MTFLWPPMLWLLAVVPTLIAVYALVLRRRRSEMLRFASLRMVDEALQDTRLWRQHVPATLFLVGVTALLFAAARPVAVLTLPLQEETVILAIDVSGSMRATDIYPDRLSVAQAAAKQFVAAKSETTRVGIVEFAGTALLAQSPTAVREDLVAAIDSLRIQDATAIGGAIVASLKALFPQTDFEEIPRGGEPSRKAFDTSVAIVLLTDGENTAGPEPVQVARLAAAQGVRVFTVGLGTEEGDLISGAMGFEQVRLDERALRTIAEMTGAAYFRADSLVELAGIYETLSAELVMASRRSELTLPLAAAAGLTLVLGATLSLLWTSRIF